MKFTEGSFYHIYNRGNNKQLIFFNHENYLYFLRKVKKYLYPNCNIIAWVLMPNHFHFLVQATSATCRLVRHTPIPINALTEGIRLLLSSYTKGIQKQESYTGNLFQQKTRSKCVDEYAQIVFHYIHQNPYRANKKNWKYSSLQEYLNNTDGLCCKDSAYKDVYINPATILKYAGGAFDEKAVKDIF